MAFFTSTCIPKSKEAEIKPLIQDSDDDYSSGYDSPVYTSEDKKIPTPLFRSETYLDDSDSDFSSDEDFRGDDSFSDSDDDLDDIVQSTNDEDDGDSLKVTSMKALIDNMKYILSMSDLCDVTFLVGPQRVPIHGLKSVLGSRSRTLFSLFLREATELNNQLKTKKRKENKTGVKHKTTVIIESYDVEVFRSFILFLHCGSVTIDANIVTGLLCCAAEFDIADLNNACWEFINICSSASFACVIKETFRYGNHSAAKQLRKCMLTRGHVKKQGIKMAATNEFSTSKETDV